LISQAVVCCGILSFKYLYDLDILHSAPTSKLPLSQYVSNECLGVAVRDYKLGYTTGGMSECCRRHAHATWTQADKPPRYRK
jgi:hypothetical protein